MNVFLLEPFFGGSHKQWAEGLKKFSSHKISLFTLPAKNWKWRMHGAAVTLAKFVNEQSQIPKVILASSMMDVSVFKALVNERISRAPFIYYMHENQLTYPFSTNDSDIKQKRDNHYAFIQFTNCLVANQVWFNSLYHKEVFLNSLYGFLKQFPKPKILESIDDIKSKSMVVPVGLTLPKNLMPKPKKEVVKTILWNHRWEEDKNPVAFFEALANLKQNNVPFKLIICGESKGNAIEVFKRAKVDFENEIIHFGFAKSRDHYWDLLQKADITLITSNQEFFGISFLESLHAGCYPIVPNRLVYPQYFSAEPIKNEIVYSSEIERDKLISSALTKSKLPQFQQIPNKFNWENVISYYDERLKNLPNNY